MITGTCHSCVVAENEADTAPFFIAVLFVIELDPRDLNGGPSLFVLESNAFQFPIEALLLRLE